MSIKTLYNNVVFGIEDLYYKHGILCSRYSFKIITLTCCIIVLMSIGIMYSPLVHGNAIIEWRSLNSNRKAPTWYNGNPLAVVQHIVLQDKRESTFEAIKIMFDIQKEISQTTVNNKSFKDICYKVKTGEGISGLPGTNHCLILSPTLLWDNDLVSFLSDPDVRETVYQQLHSSYQSNQRALLFGLNWPISPPPIVLTMFLSPDVDPETVSLFRNQVMTMLSHNYTTTSVVESEFNLDYAMIDSTNEGEENRDCVHIFFSNKMNVVELIPLIILYSLVFIYIVISVRKITLVKSKIGLACTAVATIVFSFIMSIGFCASFNLLPTLSGSDIFPYIFTLIGLENVLTITRSVTITTGDKETSIRIAQGLSREGFRITKNMLGLAGVFVIGMLSPVPATFHEFCVVALVSVICDFFLQLFFFVPVLSLDIRRLELTDLKSGPYPAPSVPVNGKLLDWTDRPRKTRIFRYRTTHKILMLSVCMYVLYVLYHSLFTELPPDQRQRTSSGFTTGSTPILQMMQKLLNIDNPKESLQSSYDSLVPHYFFTVSIDQSWRRVARDTWPSLMEKYNLSLTARYFNVYKPISVGNNTQPINYHIQVKQWLQMPLTLHLISTMIGLITFLPLSGGLYLLVVVLTKLFTASQSKRAISNAVQNKNTIEIPYIFNEHQEDIMLIASNEKELLTSSTDCMNMLWCHTTGDVKLRITSDAVPWSSVILNSRIILGHRDGRLSILNRVTTTISTLHSHTTGVVFLDKLDQSTIVVCYEEGSLETIGLESDDLWDPNPTLLSRTRLHAGSQLKLCQSNQTLAVVSTSCSIRVYCARTHKILHVLQLPDPIRRLVLHRDMICANTTTSNVVVISLITKTMANISYENCEVTKLVCNDDWIVGITRSKTIIVWERYTDYQPTSLDDVEALDIALLHDIYLVILSRDSLHVWNFLDSSYVDRVQLTDYIGKSSGGSRSLYVRDDCAVVVCRNNIIPITLSNYLS